MRALVIVVLLPIAGCHLIFPFDMSSISQLLLSFPWC
jgi:hypothetical protein